MKLIKLNHVLLALSFLWFTTHQLVTAATSRPSTVLKNLEKQKQQEKEKDAAAASSSSSSTQNNNQDDDETSIPQCKLWMAPSHTGTDKEPKFGLFAGVDYKQNETIPNPEIAIPLIDFVEDFHAGDNQVDLMILNFVESYLWTAEFVGTKWEGLYSAPVAIPGIGVLANYHSGTYNVDFLQASVLLNSETIFEPGVPHPARGAITPYSNVTLYATEDIPAGMELFANFGDVWDGNYTDDAFQDKINRFDYQNADEIVDAFLKFFEEYGDQMSPELQEDILDFLLETVLEHAAEKHAKTIRSLIPAAVKKLPRVKQYGGTFPYRYRDIVKSQKWLQKHGICLDTIRPGKSTIPDAGRGAFATRKISRKETIAPVPMLHISNKDLMNMYEIVEVGKYDIEYNVEKPYPPQLLLNYCFGHPESSLLLFPLGSLVTMINHKPPDKSPNAYITWSKHESIRNDHDWHDLTVEEVAQQSNIGIVMRVVAIKDIEPGEEIFIDYGKEWEQAWASYKEQWDMNVKDQPWPLQAVETLNEYKNKPFQTQHTIRDNMYPPNIATACYLSTDHRSDGKPKFDDNGNQITEWVAPSTYEDFSGDQLYIVDILEREQDPNFFYNYTVVARVGADTIEQIVNVPHYACTFASKPYTSDIHTPGAFRHYIGIIDSHFPQMWRDLRG